MVIKVIDNFLTSEQFNKVRSILFDKNFEWYYEPHMVATDCHYFNHCFYSHNRPRTNYFYDVEFILQQPSLNHRSLVRMTNNLVTAKDKPYESEWHTDYVYPDCTTAILYFNDCNGKTLFKTDKGVEEVNTKANRIVIFPATTEHKMISQTDANRRVLMNINYF